MRGPPEDSCVVLAYHAIRSNQPKSPRAALLKPSSPISGCGGANERPGSPGALHSNREAQEQRGSLPWERLQTQTPEAQADPSSAAAR